jgi:hypothetical protein
MNKARVVARSQAFSQWIASVDEPYFFRQRTLPMIDLSFGGVRPTEGIHVPRPEMYPAVLRIKNVVLVLIQVSHLQPNLLCLIQLNN